MNKKLLGNVLMNLTIMVIFVFLNNKALQNGLEETFISMAMVYGMTVVFVNAIYIAKFCAN